MKKMTRYIFLSLLILQFLNGCSSKNNSNEDIFQFRNSYIGDNSAVGGILRQLPGNEQFKQFSLQTKEEPSGMVLEYKDTQALMTEAVIRETIIYNATFIFALVKNAEWITFDFEGQKHLITREKLQKWYGKELKEFLNEEELRKFTQEHLRDKNKLNQFFEK